jgi:hypothetical protein
MHVGNNRTSFLMDKALPAQSMKAMNDKRDLDFQTLEKSPPEARRNTAKRSPSRQRDSDIPKHNRQKTRPNSAKLWLRVGTRPSLLRIMATKRPYDQSNEQNLTLPLILCQNVQNYEHEASSRPAK